MNIKYILIAIFFCVIHNSYAQKQIDPQAVSDSISIKESVEWTILYNAFAKILGAKPANFQLMIPFTNWPAADSGNADMSYTEYSLLDNLPVWSTTGKYQSGSSYTDAYSTFLEVLIYVPDSLLFRYAMDQYYRLRQTADNYLLSLAQADTAYSQCDCTYSFDTWLNTPYTQGPKYKSIMDAELDMLDVDTELFDEYIFQLPDSILTKARADFSDTNYYIDVFDRTIEKTLFLPGYSALPSSKNWVKENKKGESIQFDWTAEWSGNKEGLGRDSVPPLRMTLVGDTTQNTLYFAGDIDVSLHFDAWGIEPVTPLPWYSEAIIKAKGFNEDGLRPGFTTYQPPTGTPGGWIFGEDGVIPSRTLSLLVGYKATVVISVSADLMVSLNEESIIGQEATISMNDFTFSGIVSDVKEVSGSFEYTIENQSDNPFFWGIMKEDFGFPK